MDSKKVSSPILNFSIPEEYDRIYKNVGIDSYLFDRTSIKFQFKLIDGRIIEVSISKGEKMKDIVSLIQETLVKQIPLIEDKLEAFNNGVIANITTQISDNLDKIHKTYVDEQADQNPLVKDAFKVIEEHKGEKITEEDIEFIIETIKLEAPEDDLAIRQLFYGDKSTFTNLVIPTEVNSRGAGHGKSYLQDKVLYYEDEKYIRDYADISDKALYHQDGVRVIEDPLTKELTVITPIIAELRSELKDIEAELDEEKSKPSATAAAKQENTQARDKRRIKELEARKRNKLDEISDLEGKSQKLIDLGFKIINVGDTPNRNIFHTLMAKLSQDSKKDLIYQYTDKSDKGHQQSKDIRLRGTPGFIYSQVVIDNKDPRERERSRRFVKVIPKTTEEKISHATDQIWDSGGLTDDEYDEDVVSRVRKEKAKQLSSLLSAKLIAHSVQFGHKQSGIRIPYLTTLKLAARNKRMAWQMTVQDRAKKYLSVITLTRMDSRPKLVNKKTGQVWIISTFKDLQEMFYLMQHGALGIRPYLADWYNNVFLKVWKEKGHLHHTRKSNKKGEPLDVEEEYNGLYAGDLKEETFKFLGEVLSPKRIMEDLVNPLYDQGIIDKIPSSIDGRGISVLQPVEEESQITSDFIDNSSTKDYRILDKNPTGIRIKIKDPAAFPSKEMLKKALARLDKTQKQVERVVEGRPTFFEKNFVFDDYDFIDVDGNEISLDKLLDDYFSNPEDYFVIDTSDSDTDSNSSGSKPDNGSQEEEEEEDTPTGDTIPTGDQTPIEEQTQAQSIHHVEQGREASENIFLKKVESPPTTYSHGFLENNQATITITDPEKPLEQVVQPTPTFFKKNICAFDLEYATKPDCFNRQHITWFSLVDNTGYIITKSAQNYSSYPEPEKELVKDFLELLMKYEVSLGWYSTGLKDKKGRGRNSDLKVLYDAIWNYGLINYKIINRDTEYPYLMKIVNKPHITIDLCLLYRNSIVKNNIYEDRYDEGSLDAVSRGLLGEGKYNNLSGVEAENQPYEEQKKYVTQDATLTLQLAQFENFNILNIFQNISEITGLPLDTVCHTNSATWWEAGITKEGGAERIRPFRQKKVDYRGGYVMTPKPMFYNYSNTEQNGHVEDIASEYPTGIDNLNLSPETIDCECCKDDSTAKIAQVYMDEINNNLLNGQQPRRHYWTCRKKRGFIAELIKKYKKIRLEYKKLAKQYKGTELEKEYQAKQQAMKILINSLYGTFGQGSFAFSDYRLAEITTAFGRVTWRRLKALAESPKYNFKVIYGDTDSIFIINIGSEERLKEFLDDWHTQEQNKDIEVEDEEKKKFKMLLITKSKHYILVPSNSENPIIVKGMEGKKSDRPTWINKIQYEMSRLLHDTNQIKELFRREYERMESGNVPIDELIMKKELGKDPKDYPKTCVQKTLGLKQGLIKYDTVKYYLSQNDGWTSDPLQISRKEYLDMLQDTFEDQLTPLEINFETDIKNCGMNLSTYQ